MVELGCKSNYENNSQVVHHVKFVSALAFLPVHDVEGFRTLTNHFAFPVEATQIARYFHKIFIGLNQPGIKRRATIVCNKVLEH